MKTGTYISGIGHAALIGFALFGPLFDAKPLPPPQTADVQLLSEEEFAALTRPEVSPEVAAEAPAPAEIDTQTAEEAAPTPPEPDTTPEVQPAPPASAPEAPSETETAPLIPAPPPEAEVVDDSPSEPAPPPVQQDLPRAPEAAPRPSQRVAPDTAPPPPPEADQAPVLAETTTPEPAEPEDQLAEVVPPTAPEEAAPEIVTEAEPPASPEEAPTEPEPQRSATAPQASPRPRNKPAPPVRTAEAPPAETPAPPAETPEPTPAPAETPQPQAPAAAEVRDAVNDALAGLMANETATNQGEPSGPPLTRGEKDALRVAVQNCWVVDVGSEASNVVVTIGFDMNRDGTVVSSSLKMLSASGGSDSAIKTAFETGRRAILRCQSSGYDLPDEKYGQWKQVEITFNPDDMRTR